MPIRHTGTSRSPGIPTEQVLPLCLERVTVASQIKEKAKAGKEKATTKANARAARKAKERKGETSV